MEAIVFYYIFLLLWTLPFSFGEVRQREDLLHYCLDGENHKNTPSSEDTLHQQCTPWRRRSCCTHSTTISLHYPFHLNFNMEHCGKKSEQCMRHFIQDTCFYECSPNIGPWVVKVDMKIRNERFFKVPLCASECNAWYNDCKDDLTCTDNWVSGYKQIQNNCSYSTCNTFQNIYQNASNFCEKIWDSSWKVVPDTEPCMKIWFDENNNPNDKVTQFYVDKMGLHGAGITPTSSVFVSILPITSFMMF